MNRNTFISLIVAGLVVLLALSPAAQAQQEHQKAKNQEAKQMDQIKRMDVSQMLEHINGLSDRVHHLVQNVDDILKTTPDQSVKALQLHHMQDLNNNTKDQVDRVKDGLNRLEVMYKDDTLHKVKGMSKDLDDLHDSFNVTVQHLDKSVTILEQMNKKLADLPAKEDVK